MECKLFKWLGNVAKVALNDFRYIEHISGFDKSFIKSYNEEFNEVYFHIIGVQYPKKLHDLHNDLPFIPERMKIEKVEKIVSNLHDKTQYVMHRINSRQASHHQLVLKKVHRVIKFNQNA